MSAASCRRASARCPDPYTNPYPTPDRIMNPDLILYFTLTLTRSELEACFTMVNGILGAGVLGYPFAFRSCGLIAAAGLVLLCLSACQLSMRFLLLSRWT